MRTLVLPHAILSIVLMTVVCAEAQENFAGCGMAGDAIRPSKRQWNRQKNRYVAPAEQQVNRAITLKAMLQPGVDGNRWPTEVGAEIIGFVASVRAGALEGCNCHAQSISRRDTEIDLVLSPSDTLNKRRHVIVEITPRWRATVARRGINWTTQALANTIVGKWVKIRGWMFFDAEDQKVAENTHHGDPRNRRGTVWELHPVTSLEVVDEPITNPLEYFLKLLHTVPSTISDPLRGRTTDQ